MSTLKVNAIQGVDGVERYLARAWVNFNGTGTVAIRASGNVTSITDQAVGQYVVNFTNALPDANYSAVATCGSTNQNTIACTQNATTTGCLVTAIFATAGSTVFGDSANINVAIFR